MILCLWIGGGSLSFRDRSWWEGVGGLKVECGEGIGGFGDFSFIVVLRKYSWRYFYFLVLFRRFVGVGKFCKREIDEVGLKSNYCGSYYLDGIYYM